MRNDSEHWALACHLQYEQGAGVRIIERKAGRTTVHAVPEMASAGGVPPVYLGVVGRQVVLMDRPGSTARLADALVEDALGLYAYPEPGSQRFWYSNDGDGDTGNDALYCGDRGASMTVVEAMTEDALPRVLGTICVGRGHHVPTFPGAGRAYISNLEDGTVSVLGNDPAKAAEYLNVIGAINLCEPEREKDGRSQVPNKAYPHGQVYSPLTKRIYELNNGYGTIAVIDPVADRIEARIDFPGCSNLLLSPDGRYIVGKGADRKRDPEHVLGRIAVLDVVTGKIVASIDVPDVYPSTCRFNAEGTRLYVTTAATGKGAQRERLVLDRVLVYDATAFPRLERIDDLEVGVADCGRRPIAFFVEAGVTRLIFVPNPSADTLTIIDGVSGRARETVTLAGAKPVEELNFSFLGAGGFYGS
ncbi:MAG: hypothetical protein LBV36_07245 [Chromatiales bacterium]|jgi:hypothetical protein|nr:hypothetical protein [Chromatiales bacterium]